MPFSKTRQGGGAFGSHTAADDELADPVPMIDNTPDVPSIVRLDVCNAEAEAEKVVTV